MLTNVLNLSEDLEVNGLSVPDEHLSQPDIQELHSSLNPPTHYMQKKEKIERKYSRSKYECIPKISFMCTPEVGEKQARKPPGPI